MRDRYLVWILCCLFGGVIGVTLCSRVILRHPTEPAMSGVYDISFQSGYGEYLGYQQVILYPNGTFLQQFRYPDGKYCENTGRWEVGRSRDVGYLYLNDYVEYVDSFGARLMHPPRTMNLGVPINRGRSIALVLDADNDYHMRRIGDVPAGADTVP